MTNETAIYSVYGLQVISPEEALRALPPRTHTWGVNSNCRPKIAVITGDHRQLLTMDAPGARRSQNAIHKEESSS